MKHITCGTKLVLSFSSVDSGILCLVKDTMQYFGVILSHLQGSGW